MSRAREPLPPGPEGPEHRAADETSPLISLPLEKCEKESTALNGRELQQTSMNRSTTTETHQTVWGDHTHGDLIKRESSRKTVLEREKREPQTERSEDAATSAGQSTEPPPAPPTQAGSTPERPTTAQPCSPLLYDSPQQDPAALSPTPAQPQRLPKPNASVLEQSPEETAKIQNGHAGLSNGNSIHNGVKHGTTDHRKLSAPVSQKMHRKLQSSLSVSSDGSKKSRESSTYSEAGASPEDCCVHCILACLFCEFLTLCNVVLGQASCGVCTSEACCCCCGEEMGDDCNCPCDMDCGIMDACCESSDCLEICMECCGICFPT
ncbi:myoD family inhibitor domain-containing protein isoform X1 [Lissotriton helveticus]